MRMLTLTIVGVMLACAAPARADEGMWLLNDPPLAQLKQKYGFAPDAAWLEHLQKSCVRISSGGSGSIVSADGLVMTNHHVGSDMLEKLSSSSRDLLRNGFYARTRAEELKCPDLEIHVLWTIEDVTQRVNQAVTAGMDSAAANAARQKAIATIEAEAEKSTGLDCQMVTLWQGAKYHLYSYRRYTDIRLVMAPEQAIAYFGGDNDNFEYPRFDLDMCFFRIYDNDQPLKPEHHLTWSANGSKEHDLALVCGHPGRTQRMFTVDHLKFLRDVDLPFSLDALYQREVALFAFMGRSQENERIGRNEYYGITNSRKAYTGIMDGMLDSALIQTKQQAESELRKAVQNNPQWRSQWGDAWDQIARAENTYRSFYPRYQVLERRGNLRSDLYGFARTLVRLAAEKSKPNSERLRGFRDSEMDSLELDLYSPTPIEEALEIHRLSVGLTWLANTLGAADHAAQVSLAGKSPSDRAAELVMHSKLKDVGYRRSLAQGGMAAIKASDDPLIQLALALDDESRALRKRYEDEVEGDERGGYAKIAAAEFAVHGTNAYPDATFTLRLAYGPVLGYQEQGHAVPAYTTLAGAYERMQERHGVEPFQLPESWLAHKKSLDLNTPFNFVCTADIIGGNSGSPVVNTNGEVIGLIFDGNLQSLIWDIAYTNDEGRAVAVDSRAIIEALRKVYDAGALADELQSK
jgi:hypothetical protein